MSGWDGAGNVVRVHNWQVDSANSVMITDSRMDAEFDMLTTAIENTLARDGQNKPSAHIDWNNKKITNLAAGVAGTDAARVDQIPDSLDEWIAETYTTNYVNATQFKVMAADATGWWHIGRRFKATTTGGTRYGTVYGVSYGAPDTTVTLVLDSGSLDAGLTDVHYGALSYVNPSYLPPTTQLPECLIVACSNETTPLVAVDDVITFRAPYAMTLTSVRASLTTAQTSGSIFTVRVNKNGTTIFSTNLTIDNNEKTSTTAATPAVLSVTTLADDDEITVDITQVGNGTATGLKLVFLGRRTL